MNKTQNKSSDKLATLWFDLKTSINSVDIPRSFQAYCAVTHVVGLVEADVKGFDPDLIVLEFDYPSRADMERAARLKIALPGVPMVVVTLQHSEALAVWFFRKKFIDFLVQPVIRPEVVDCLAEIQRINTLRRSQKPRQLAEQHTSVPLEVGAGATGVRPMQAALELVARSYFESISVTSAAAACHMQPFKFGRDFKDTFGVDFRDYVVRFRIREACRLLRNPNAQVSEIAYAVGFSEPSYFSKTFKRLVGTTPSQALGVQDLDFEISAAQAYRDYLNPS